MRLVSRSSAIVLIGLLLGSSSIHAQGADAAPTLTLLDAGQAPRRLLRYGAATGDRRATQMTLRMNTVATLEGRTLPTGTVPAITTTINYEVVAVDATGDMTIDVLYSSAHVVEEPGVTAQTIASLQKAIGAINGIHGRMVQTNRGGIRSMSFEPRDTVDPLVKEQVDRMNESVKESLTLLPEEPVGPGARWQITRPTFTPSARAESTQTFTLKDLSEREFSASVDVVMKADPQEFQVPDMPAGTTVHLDSMSGSGVGSITVGLGSFTPHRSELSTKMDTGMTMTTRGAKQRMSQTMTMTVSIADAAPAR